MKRKNNRKNHEIRPIRIIPDYLKYAEGSCLIEMGDNKVICSVTVQDSVPKFLKDKNSGWLTAEYSMIPRATQERNIRERIYGRMFGRTQEIQRLIGRVLRHMIDFNKLGKMTFFVDCDVIQADGGTRTASINGASVALVSALNRLKFKNIFDETPLKQIITAISVGVVDNRRLIDLDFEEDANAELDFNIIQNDKEEIIEIQGIGEKRGYSVKELNELIKLAKKGIKLIYKEQQRAIKKSYNNIFEQMK